MEEPIAKLIKRLSATQLDEIDCDTCLERISEYVDRELGQAGTPEDLLRVRQHLEQCGVCLEEYILLRELAALEQAGKLPESAALARQLARRLAKG